jgi:hypothetical protein
MNIYKHLIRRLKFKWSIQYFFENLGTSRFIILALVLKSNYVCALLWQFNFKKHDVIQIKRQVDQ